MDFHRQNDWFIQHFFKMLHFNVMDVHERPSMAMTLSTGLYFIQVSNSPKILDPNFKLDEFGIKRGWILDSDFFLHF